MPELPEVESVRRALERVMVGATFDEVVLRRPDLRTPFPEAFATRLTGRTVVALTRRAKYLLAEASSGDSLVMHLGMSGDFRVERAGAPLEIGVHDHVVFRMSSGARIVFNDYRRFGFMDLVPTAQLTNHASLRALGPEPLSASFDAATLARACHRRRVAIKIALLDQRVVAGLGNIYAVEALHRARVSPFRRASTLATRSGGPRESAVRLAAAIKHVLEHAIDRAGRADDRAGRFRVYERAGQRCLRRGCGGRIARRLQAGRSTFYCPVCQR